MSVGEEQFAHLPTGIDLCHQTFGDPADPTVLLVMGLGGPMGWWRTAFSPETTILAPPASVYTPSARQVPSSKRKVWILDVDQVWKVRESSGVCSRRSRV